MTKTWLLPLLAAAGVAMANGATPAQAQRRGAAATPALRAAELQKLNEIEALLRTTRQCVSSATSLQALRSCHQREREGEWSMRQRHQQRMDAVRQRYGMDSGPRFGGPGAPPGSPPGPPPGPPSGAWGPPPRW